LSQADLPFAVFHVEHVLPKKHGGSDDASNLALACDRCNFHKGPNISGIDEKTRRIVPLFDPRGQVWSKHFRSVHGVIIGRTACGRATVAVCVMNAPERMRLRRSLRS
jgi:hypothetical protein